MSLIRAKYLSTAAQCRPMDFARKTQYFTLDVISDIGFGKAFGDLAADADVDDYLAASEAVTRFFVVPCAIGLVPILQWGPIARFIGPEARHNSGMGKAMASARKLIDARLHSGSGRADMLAAFIRHGLNREDLFAEAWLQIIAGSESTSSAIRGTMFYIIATPRVYLKLQREIDETVSSGAAPGIVSDAVAKELVYLQAVLREGLRIRPPVTNIVPKKVPKGGDTMIVDGNPVYFPGGTNIGLSINGIFSRRDIFGEDADSFRPERWILADDGSGADRLVEMKRTSELLFGYGKYKCLGQNIAWMEYSKIVFEVCTSILIGRHGLTVCFSYSDILTLRLQSRRRLGMRTTAWAFIQ